jgi:hypothetical protein
MNPVTNCGPTVLHWPPNPTVIWRPLHDACEITHIFVCEGIPAAKGLIINIRRYCAKFSAASFVHPWPEVTCLHGTAVWAMGVTPYKTGANGVDRSAGRDTSYSGAWRHITLFVTGILWWLLDVWKICGPPGEKISDDDRSTELTITVEIRLKNRTKEINCPARGCLVDHQFIRQLSVGNSDRFLYLLTQPPTWKLE